MLGTSSLWPSLDASPDNGMSAGKVTRGFIGTTSSSTHWPSARLNSNHPADRRGGDARRVRPDVLRPGPDQPGHVRRIPARVRTSVGRRAGERRLAADDDGYGTPADQHPLANRHDVCANAKLRGDGNTRSLGAIGRQPIGHDHPEPNDHAVRDVYPLHHADRQRNADGDTVANRHLDLEPDAKPHADANPLADGNQHTGPAADEHAGPDGDAFPNANGRPEPNAERHARADHRPEQYASRL